ncbi:ABC transporter family substrate-binding protein [Kitasatospora atroaurantiaca]|uniref:Peptide/nickel transport system substrate-binding protein n=1 Tax=Kitasatospora atroaurantiaca TaxID=285545 RepID=A0A561EUL1_9ACTN|nr:ABC transporter family substrate-binding protein [Kitasatospora atroaurantiaca]TWE19300.1 peptide/nickel transport system substrate-binding protein [Kitasatospora atroaurantiaca]
MRANQVTAAALALLLTTALAGCSDDSGSAATAYDVTAANRADVRDGGTLRWAVDAVPATLNVFQPEATDDSGLLARALLPSLFRLDGHARPDADPDYLVEAESTPAGQTPQTVTYRLNPKAVWSDGTPISAADFTAQWHALSGADPAYHSDHPAGYAAITAVAQGADAHEVKVTFKQAYAPWRSLFSPLYPAAATSTPAAFNQPLADSFRTSAGPFTIREYDRTGGKATLARNPRWWGDAPKAEAIDFLATPAANRLDALDQGKLDVAALTTSVDRAAPGGVVAAAPPDAAAMVEASVHALKRAESLPGLTLHRAAAPAFTQLTLNATRGPLTDLAVRRAVARAVDRQRIATAALSPLGLSAVPLGNHLLMTDQEGYQDNSGAVGGEAAGKMLDEAGWKAGAAARTKDGKDLSLALLIPDGSATARRTADALTANLAEAGITVHSQPVAVGSFVKDHLATGDYDLALFSWPATGYPAGDERALYAKPQPGPDGLPVIGRNYARTGTEEIDHLFDRAAAELDPAAQHRLLQQADARIWQLAHSVPLFQRPDLVAVRNNVAGAGAYGFTSPRFQDLGFRKGA